MIRSFMASATACLQSQAAQTACTDERRPRGARAHGRPTSQLNTSPNPLGAGVVEPHLLTAERRPLVQRPRVLVVAPRVDAVDRPVHQALPAHAVHARDRDRHPADALALDRELAAVGVDRVDEHAPHEAVLGIALASLRARHHVAAHAVEQHEPTGTGAEERGLGRRHAGDVGAAPAVVLPLLRTQVPPRVIAHRVAVDGDLFAVQDEVAGDAAELVEMTGLGLAGLAAALHAPAVGDAHPRRVHRAPVEVEADDVAVGEGEPVVLQRIEHLDALTTREREVAQVALGGQRRVPVVDVVRRLEVEPRGVVEHEHPTAGDADGRPHVVVAPAAELALGVEEPEPERLVLPPVVRLGLVEVVVVEVGLVAFAELGLLRKHRHACTPFVRRVRSVTSWSSRLSRISPCVPHSRSPFGSTNDANPPATSPPCASTRCRRRSDRGRAPVPAGRSRSWCRA